MSWGSQRNSPCSRSPGDFQSSFSLQCTALLFGQWSAVKKKRGTQPSASRPLTSQDTVPRPSLFSVSDLTCIPASDRLSCLGGLAPGDSDWSSTLGKRVIGLLIKQTCSPSTITHTCRANGMAATAYNTHRHTDLWPPRV